ncbi:MAG: hypothetical protein ACOYOR_00040 [Flavobacterium psychrophilum]|jgi:hypothetical protein
MNLDPNTGSIITQAQAKKLITAFENQFPDEVIYSIIGANNVKNILNQEKCIGLRIYNGYDEEEQKISIVLVGYDQDGKDILANGIIYDKMATCPPLSPNVGIL